MRHRPLARKDELCFVLTAPRTRANTGWKYMKSISNNGAAGETNAYFVSDEKYATEEYFNDQRIPFDAIANKGR